jgi:excisionase family DNA binding protein
LHPSFLAAIKILETYAIWFASNKGGTMPDAVTQDKRLTANEVAKMLGLDRDTIYKWARAGRIPCIKLRHRLRFRLGDIERWEKQQTVGKF